MYAYLTSMNAWHTSSDQDRKAAKAGKLGHGWVFRPDLANPRTRLRYPEDGRELRRTKKKQNWKTRLQPGTNVTNQRFCDCAKKLDRFIIHI